MVKKVYISRNGIRQLNFSLTLLVGIFLVSIDIFFPKANNIVTTIRQIK